MPDDLQRRRPHQQPLVVDVALNPGALGGGRAPRANTTFIVVDVIRATTTLSVFFEAGCRRVFVAPSLDAARAAHAALGPTYLLAGEEDGARPAGFDFGNSPAEIAAGATSPAWALADRAIIFATTNGTRALHACMGGRAVLAGALRNARAVCAAAIECAASRRTGADDAQPAEGDDNEAAPDIRIVCSGRADGPAYDDTLCAGYLVQTLIAFAGQPDGQGVTLTDGARIALVAAADAERYGRLRAALAVSAAARAIERIGLASDLDWCADVDVSALVPRVVGADLERDLLVVEAARTALQGP